MRRKSGLRISVAMALSLAGCANAAAVAPSPTAARDPELATPKTDGALAPASFLEGRWVSSDGKYEETWTPSGNVLVGVSFTTRDGKTVEWEALAVDEQAGALGFTAMVNGEPPVRFVAQPSVNAGAARLVFANAAHDFPKLVTYARAADGVGLTARVEADDPSHALTYAWSAAPRAPAKTLEEADQIFDEDVARRGVDAWVDAFDESGAMLRENGRAEGHDAVRAEIAPLFASGAVLRWAPIASGFSKSHDLGFTVGRYVSRRRAQDGGAGRTGHGTYVTLWRVGENGRPRVLFDTGFPEARPEAK